RPRPPATGLDRRHGTPDESAPRRLSGFPSVERVAVVLHEEKPILAFSAALQADWRGKAAVERKDRFSRNITEAKCFRRLVEFDERRIEDTCSFEIEWQIFAIRSKK